MNTLSKTNTTDNPTHKIDKEHVTIEKIFRITLNPDSTNNFYYLEDYHAILMSMGDEYVKFRINNLESLMLQYLFTHEEIKKDIMNYLLVTYHRAVIMIERK